MTVTSLLLNARSYLRLTPFDVTTTDGRTAERYRLATLSLLANVLSKSASMLLMILSVYLTLPYLGSERFGIWMTIASFAGMLTFLDFGIGNGLVNQVARAAVENQPDQLRRVVCGGLGILFILALSISIILSTVAAYLVPWDVVIKLNGPDLEEETRQLATLFAVLFGLSVFTSGIQKIFVGLQRAFESHLVSTLGVFGAIAALWVAAQSHASTPILFLATFGTQCVTMLLLLPLLVRRKLIGLAGLRSALIRELPNLVRTGGLFFLLQVATMAAWGADSLIIASTLGATYVTVYSVTQRLFQFVSLPLAMGNSPLWSAYADAHARGDYNFIRNTLRRATIATSAAAFGGCIIIVVCSPWIIPGWTNGKAEVPLAFILVFACWSIVETTANAFAMFMNGCHVVKPQVVAAISLCFFSIPVKLLAIGRFGLVGFTLSFLLIFLINLLINYAILFRDQINSALGRSK